MKDKIVERVKKMSQARNTCKQLNNLVNMVRKDEREKIKKLTADHFWSHDLHNRRIQEIIDPELKKQNKALRRGGEGAIG